MLKESLATRDTELAKLQASHGRHCHSTLSLTGIDCPSLGVYTVILLSLLSFSVIMTVSGYRRRRSPACAKTPRRPRGPTVNRSASPGRVCHLNLFNTICDRMYL
jgi:hypothetical protein